MSIFKTLGNATGLTSSFNSGQATRNLKGYDQDLSNGQAVYDSQMNSLNTQSGQLAGQNYLGGAQDAYNKQLDAYAQQGQAFRNQQTASQMLYNQATGQTPSVADLQMQTGLGNANNQAQSAAYSQQGGVSPGLTQRNLLNAQAMQNANIVGQGQIARAGEVTQAQQMYNNVLGNISNSAANYGQTAQGLNSSQQNLANFMYQQGQNNLQYQAQNALNQQNVNATNAGNLYGAQVNRNAAQTAANTAQAGMLSGTLSAATNPSGFLMQKVAPKVLPQTTT